MITLVLGGAKSGKTRWALKYAETLSNFTNYYYLATATPSDEEMKEKIKKHKEERSEIWRTIEEPIEIISQIRLLKTSSHLLLLDCLTLWISNLLFAKCDWERYFEELLEELNSIKGKRTPWIILISNEVGLGLVPDNKLGRLFRELIGLLNQRIAERADEVFFIVAGLPLTLKREI